MKPNASPYSPQTTEYAWRDIYPELVNKIRWAICTSLKTPSSNYPYGLAQSMATVLSGFAIAIVKQEQSVPGSSASPGLIRSTLNQLDAQLDLDNDHE